MRRNREWKDSSMDGLKVEIECSTAVPVSVPKKMVAAWAFAAA